MISKNVYPYLNDSQFLQQLDTSHIKTYFAKIEVLTWQEELIDNIEGKVISASINIDGNSIIRRTASLNMIADGIINDLTRVDNLISINKKMRLYIGFLNTTDRYTEFKIFYFPLGVYVISSAAISHSLDSVNISLQLKDKMCLLNGENGGVFPASTQLHQVQTIDSMGNNIITYPTIYQIIVEVVNHFGGQDLSRILISDLDTRVKQVVTWMGDIPVYIQEPGDITTNSYFSYQAPSDKELAERIKKEPGQQIGFIITDFIYPGQLVADAGAAVTSILDNIIGILGNYEYFYDVDGNFRFQQKKNFLNNSQASYILESLRNVQEHPESFSLFDDPAKAYILDYFTTKKAQYVFNGGEIINSFNNNLQYQNIKNDFIVWGVRKNGQVETPIRYHLAIDNIPQLRTQQYLCFKYINPDTELEQFHSLIEEESYDLFPQIGQQGLFYLDKSTLVKNEDGSYEGNVYQWKTVDDKTNYYQVSIQKGWLLGIIPKDWRTELYLQGLSADPLGLDSNYYYTELKNEWPKIYDIQNGCIRDQYIYHPQNLNYYLDIIDSSTIVGQFSAASIGRRTTVQNLNNDANCIFEPDIPNVVFIQNTSQSSSLDNDTDTAKIRQEAINMGLTYYQVPTSVFQYFDTQQPSFNSCYQEIRQKLQQFVSYNETISFTCLPIYYLEPNIRITVNDPDSNIYGDYLLNSMSFTIDANSTMTVNATRVLEKI